MNTLEDFGKLELRKDKEGIYFYDTEQDIYSFNYVTLEAAMDAYDADLIDWGEQPY